MEDYLINIFETCLICYIIAISHFLDQSSLQDVCSNKEYSVILIYSTTIATAMVFIHFFIWSECFYIKWYNVYPRIEINKQLSRLIILWLQTFYGRITLHISKHFDISKHTHTQNTKTKRKMFQKSLKCALFFFSFAIGGK